MSRKLTPDNCARRVLEGACGVPYGGFVLEGIEVRWREAKGKVAQGTLFGEAER